MRWFEVHRCCGYKVFYLRFGRFSRFKQQVRCYKKKLLGIMIHQKSTSQEMWCFKWLSGLLTILVRFRSNRSRKLRNLIVYLNQLIILAEILIFCLNFFIRVVKVTKSSKKKKKNGNNWAISSYFFMLFSIIASYVMQLSNESRPRSIIGRHSGRIR
jgi:hypothetical protein